MVGEGGRPRLIRGLRGACRPGLCGETGLGLGRCPQLRIRGGAAIRAAFSEEVYKAPCED